MKIYFSVVLTSAITSFIVTKLMAIQYLKIMDSQMSKLCNDAIAMMTQTVEIIKQHMSR